MKYDVIIPVAFKDYDFFKKSYNYLCENLGGEHVFILTDGKMARYLPKIIRNSSRFVIIDENSLVDGLTYLGIHSIIKSQGREHTNTGWFFQQFLKMGFALSDYCKNDYYLSWDADTIPLNKMSFFDENGKPYFTMKTEYHKPYFESMQLLLGISKVNPRSYIAEHMMFKKEYMKQLIRDINDSSVVGNVWYEKILNSIVPEQESTDSFSEFETYGSYCKIFHSDQYVERSIYGFRRGGLIQGRFISNRMLNCLACEYDVASFEIYDRPPFPWSKICDFYEKWQKMREHYIRLFSILVKRK